MKTILLIGLGNFGLNVATQLFQLGHHVMGIDIDEVKVNAALPVLSNAKIGDGTNPEFMGSLGIDNYDLCIVSTGGDFQNSLETTSLLKEFGAKKVISRADRDVQMKFLLRNGADEVVYPEKQVARWTAVRYTADHILDYIELGDDYSIFEVSVPKSWIGMTVGQLDIRKNTVSISWRSGSRAKSTSPSRRRRSFPRTSPCLCSVNTRPSSGASRSEHLTQTGEKT